MWSLLHQPLWHLDHLQPTLQMGVSATQIASHPGEGWNNIRKATTTLLRVEFWELRNCHNSRSHQFVRTDSVVSTRISFNPHNQPVWWGNWQSAYRPVLPPNSSDESTPQISLHYYPPTHCDTIINLHGRLNENPSKYSHSNRRLEESHNN